MTIATTQDNYLSLRQYPIEIHGDTFKKPTKQLFYDALHMLTDYIKGGPYTYIPFSQDFIEDLKKNDPAVVIEYGIFALEIDRQHAIRPTFYIWMLEAIKERIDIYKYLSFVEAILTNCGYSLTNNAIIQNTIVGEVNRIDLHKFYEDFIESVIINELVNEKSDIPHYPHIEKIIAFFTN